MKQRMRSLVLALVMVLSLLPVPALAAESGWLIPRMRDYPAFTDTIGSICEEAAATCCQAGLMDGVDSRHFFPSNGLSSAQIIVISARLHRLLSGGTLEYFDPISLKGPDWWTPYDGYLREQIPELAEDQTYQSLRESPVYPCYRYEFLHLLSAVLADTGTTLAQVNDVNVIPDCCDQEIIQFYRWGILGGKDQYGTLYGMNSLSRAAAAAMLARLIDPAQRLTLDLTQMELCRELLDIAPETVLMTVSGQEITAEEFMPTLVSTISAYNHSRFSSFVLDMNGGNEIDEAVKELCRQVLRETLAEEQGLNIAPSDTHWFPGYHGLTVKGQAWEDYHYRLQKAFPGDSNFPEDRLPQPEYTEAWESLNFDHFSQKVWPLPYWGGHF